MLGDSAGLGKTIQSAMAAVDHLPALVVTRTFSAQQVWADFLPRQFPGTTAANATKGQQYQRWRALKSNADWVVVNHEMMRTYQVPTHFQTMIIDESHRFRRRQAAHSKAAFELSRRIPRVYELTATPVVKEIDDLYFQLKILDPARFRSYNKFIEEFCRYYYTGFDLKVSGARNPQQLQRLMDTYMLRRTYSDVGVFLPAFQEQVIAFDLPDQLRHLYDRIRDQWRMELGDQRITFSNVLAAMQAMRQVTACNEKADIVEALLEDVDVPSVTFTWYQESADMVAKRLKVQPITGNVPPGQRTAIARSTKHAVGTISALGESVDLSDKRCVIFFEEHYTPGSIQQALTRVRRFRPGGGYEPVLGYFLVARDTIDESIYRLVRHRSASVEEIVKDALE